MQIRAQPLGTFDLHDPTISVEGNKFLLTGFQPGVGEQAESIPAQGPPLPRDPEFPLFPKGLQAKTTPRSSPSPYLSISWSRKQIPTLSGMCTCGFRSRRPLTEALSFRSGMLCSQPPGSSSGNHAMLHRITVSQRLKPRESRILPRVCCYPCGVQVPSVPCISCSVQGVGPRAQNIQMLKTQRERELTPISKVLYQKSPFQESDFSIHPSENQNSAAQHSWSQFSYTHLSCVCTWPAGSLQLRQLCRRLLQADLQADRRLDFSKPPLTLWLSLI